jgi:hypothetical protein
MTNSNEKSHATVYQVDCVTENKGKFVSSTKRRIRWRFGFADQQAMQAGKKGTDCRGAEHEVVLVWSLTSGKQLILADGQEVHWAKSNIKNKMEVSWDMLNGNHKLQVIAHASSSTIFMSSEKSKLGRIDLLIDGRSFSEMPKVFQLGSSPSSTIRTRSQQQCKTPDFAMEQTLRPPAAKVAAAPPPRRSYSMPMPDLLDLHVPVLPASSPMRQAQKPSHSSPTSSMDMSAFGETSSSTVPQTPQTNYEFCWNDTTPIQRHSTNYSGYSKALVTTPERSRSASPLFSDNNSNADSPLSAALNALGVDMEGLSLQGDDKSVTSNLSMTSVPKDISTRSYLPQSMSSSLHGQQQPPLPPQVPFHQQSHFASFSSFSSMPAPYTNF